MTARLIVALDVASASAGMKLVALLGDTCDYYKVGSELFTAAGPDVVRTLGGAGKNVFLDLKFHDIPATVRGAAAAAAAAGATLLTVHASGGRAMLEAAVEGAGAECGVLAVTVLTSIDGAELAGIWGREASGGGGGGREVMSVERDVLRLAELAASCGVHGIVCAGAEARAVHEVFGDRLRLLVAGIRSPSSARHDQQRTTTASEAVSSGASYLVIGRGVTESPDPRAAFESLRSPLERS